jgi:serine/threonine protein kinase
MSEEIERHVVRKFEIAQKLGKGAYGIVWKAVDKKTRQGRFSADLVICSADMLYGFPTVVDRGSVCTLSCTEFGLLIAVCL